MKILYNTTENRRYHNCRVSKSVWAETVCPPARGPKGKQTEVVYHCLPARVVRPTLFQPDMFAAQRQRAENVIIKCHLRSRVDPD